MTISKIKFLYFRDTLSPRVVTVARELRGDLMHISWCINKNVPFQVRNQRVWRGDTFKKSVARAITSGRLISGDSIETVLVENTSKVELAIKTVLKNSPKLVSTIIRRDVARRRREYNLLFARTTTHTCHACGGVVPVVE